MHRKALDHALGAGAPQGCLCMFLMRQAGVLPGRWAASAQEGVESEVLHVSSHRQGSCQVERL